ncbi:MAG: hypothetical protein ACKO7R_15475 [Pseudanabaena sp.]
MPTPPFPQPQLNPTGINFEQYDEFTPHKLELWDGFYNYGGQDMTGFHLAVLTNMGLHAAVTHVPMSKWLAAIQKVALQNPNLDDALRDRLLRAMDELNAVAEYLEEQ